MKPSDVFSLLPVIVGCVLISCRDGEAPQQAGGRVEARDSPDGAELTRRGTGPQQKRPRSKSSDPQIQVWLDEFSKTEDVHRKRDLFSKILVELPPEDHDLALDLVVADLGSADPAQLVSEYLEISSFMSPALQLPGMVRLLAQPRLSLLQRAAMEHQLREELEISDDEVVEDWRPLVEKHLRKLPEVLPR